MLERVSPRRFLSIRILVILALSISAHAQSTATLLGRVVDPDNASVAGAKITATNLATGVNRVGETDREGNYAIPALPVGDYKIEVQAPGFRTQLIESVSIEVSRLIVRDFQLDIGQLEQLVTVTSEVPVIERATISMGQVVDRRTTQETPLTRVLTRLLRAGCVRGSSGVCLERRHSGASPTHASRQVRCGTKVMF